MLGIFILIFIGWIITMYFKHRSEGVSADRFVLNINRKKFHHKNIPDLAETKAKHGERFDELVVLLEKHDPLNFNNAFAVKHEYDQAARTIIHRLNCLMPKEDIEKVIKLEFELLFANENKTLEFEEELFDEVFNWNEKRFTT